MSVQLSAGGIFVTFCILLMTNISKHAPQHAAFLGDWPPLCRHLWMVPRRVCRARCHQLSSPSWPGSCQCGRHWRADSTARGRVLEGEFTFFLFSLSFHSLKPWLTHYTCFNGALTFPLNPLWHLNSVLHWVFLLMPQTKQRTPSVRKWNRPVLHDETLMEMFHERFTGAFRIKHQF